MPRNLERRVEIMFPVEKEGGKKKLLHILETELADTEKAHILQPDGTYTGVDMRGKTELNSQRLFGIEAKEQAEAAEQRDTRVFEPMTAADADDR